MLDRLIANWVYGGFLAAVLLLLLTPVITRTWSPSLVVTFLLLPVYMLHQYEEHDNDRFRKFLNQTIGRGKEVLSPWIVFMINVPGVWGVIGLSLWLAAFVNIGFALIAVHLVLVNAIVHMVHSVIFRCYNPGLCTAIVLFLPFGGYALLAVQRTGDGSAFMHATGLLVAVGIHGAILAHVIRNRHIGNE
jgi:hypothetical protein